MNVFYGQLSLTFAYAAFLAACGGEGAHKLSRVILALATGHVIVFGYQLIMGVLDFSQAGPPLIVNIIFIMLLFLFRKN